MGIFLQSAATELLIFITTLLVVITTYFHNSYKYWLKKGVPTVPPTFPLGNNNVLLFKGFTIGTISKTYYDHLKERGHKFGGVYLVTEPNLVLVDPDYVRDIMSRDFNAFVDRGFYYNEKDDPVSANLFALDGQQWRDLRTKLTPTFTSSKMKLMFESVVTCVTCMLDHVDENLGKDLDAKDIMGKLTTDVIGSCAFGVDCNSFTHPDAEFRRMGKKIFHFDFGRSLRAFFIANLPKLSRYFRLTLNNKDVCDFFTKMVTDTIEVRREKQIKRSDFIQILMELGDSINLRIEDMAAQVFLFFLAGFESSSIVVSFALYELARNPQYQDKLREEISTVLSRHDGEFTYECLAEMKFLGQVFDETLRIYPPGTTLLRRAVKDYTLRDTDIVIEKGTSVLIPALGLHMDPEFYPDPEKFDPERFSEENKKTRHPYVYLPFGDGPRNCIGGRFGIMQSKVAIASTIRRFRMSVSGLTKPIRFDTTYFTLRSIDPVYLIAERV